MMRKPSCEQQDMNKGAWSKQEDQKLIDYINKNGQGCWRTLPQAAGLLRCGKSCRLRWINYLRPDLKRGKFAEDEEDLIIKLHALLGNRWSLIAGRLPGRTDNEVKNYWNSHLRRKLINMGIDPNNHRLSHKFPSDHHHHLHLHNHQTMSATSTSSSSSGMKDDQKNIANINNNDDDDDQTRKPQINITDGEININYYEQVSDAASGLEDDDLQYSHGLPDLNLDLTISIPSTLPTAAAANHHHHHHHEDNQIQNPNRHHHHHESKSSKEIHHFASSPTLLLFQ